MEVSTAGVNLTGSPTVNSVAIANTNEVAAKQDTLVSGTNIKTVNSTSLLGSGDVAVQPTLVSGTNIKTINGTSVLGSGDIVTPSTPPSGAAGAIQFTDGSAFASDSKLFWDNTNKRLGVGTNNPQSDLDILTSNGSGFIRVSALGGGSARMTGDFNFSLNARGSLTFENLTTEVARITSVGMGIKTLTNPTARLEIKGSGTTASTTTLLVQNSAGSNALEIRDDRVIILDGLPTSAAGLPTGALYNNMGILSVA
jgi:hypothetical protein